MIRGSLIVSLALAIGCAPTPDEADQTKTIIGGAADTQHPSVVALVKRPLSCGASEDLACSAVLIAPRVVLTAAHCLAGIEPDELEVAIGDDIQRATSLIAVVAGYVHPDYNPTDLPEESNDLAMLLLAEAPSVTPATLPDAPLASVVVGGDVVAVGFGAEAVDATVGTRRSGTTRIQGSTAKAIWTDDQALPCGGDSGGGLFAATGEGERLVGIIKASAENCTSFALSMRVSGYLDSFVTPGLTTLQAHTDVRPAVEAGGQYCCDACDAHTDCPLGMLCLSDRGTKRCGYRDVRVAAFGDECNRPSDPSCVPVGQGRARTCRENIDCADVEHDGCRATHGGSPVLLVLALSWLIARRRRHR